MYEDLNQRELNILFFLKRFYETNGYPPTVREIGSGTNIKSTSTVHSNLEKLELKNYIRRNPTKPRAIEFINQEEDVLLNKKRTADIPILGRVTAGLPILAVENIEDTIPLSVDFINDRDLFFLRILGKSMINAGILDGDHVLVERKKSANNGDIVLALIDEEATVKRFYKEDGRYRLQPENDFMEPIYVDQVDILGKVIGLYRML